MTLFVLLLLAGDWVAAAPGPPRTIPLQAEPPMGAKKIPGARYARLPLAGRTLLVVERKGLLRIDGRPVLERWFKLPLSIGAGGSTREVSLRVEVKDGAVSYSHSLERRGEIVLEGRLRPYVLIDGNQDLRFDDPHHDFVRFDVDGDGVPDKRFGIDSDFGCGKNTYRFARGDPKGNRVSFDVRSAQPGPPQLPDDPATIKELLRKRDPRLRFVRRANAVAVLIGQLRNPKQRDYVLTLLRDMPTPQVAAALLKLRKRLGAVVDEALLGQDDARVVKALRKDLEQGTLSERREKLRALFSVGLEHRAIAAVAANLLADSAWEWRALALLELRRTPIPWPIALRVLESLRDPSWPARLAAAEALEQARLRDVILPMIEAMERDRSERVRQALGLSLYRITGVHHGSWPPAWRKWWERDGYRFVVPLAAPPRDPPKAKKKDTGERRSVSNFYGVRISSSRVVFLIDSSGSMAIEDRRGARSRFDVAMEELVKAVRGLPRGARVNVIFFSDRIWSWRPRITELTAATRKSLPKILATHRPRGGTHLYDGFEAAFRDQEADTIVLLSDGQASGGKITWPDDIQRAILDWNALRRLRIHCVAVGYDNAMLRALAEKSGGHYLKK
jgi:Mg-chelatase subunit ChlD